MRWVPALSEMVTAPERGPPACGLNVTLIMQLAPEASVLPHEVLSEKSLAPELTVRLLIDNVPVPELNSTTFCGMLLPPTPRPPKFKKLLLSSACGAAPEPRRATA
jgi:hypothetical protein